MVEEQAGEAALREIAAVLSRRPEKDDHALARASECLARFREDLIARRRADEASQSDMERLGRLNAVISVVLGMHFPLGTPPWGELEKARVWLADLVF